MYVSYDEVIYWIEDSSAWHAFVAWLWWMKHRGKFVLRNTACAGPYPHGFYSSETLMALTEAGC